MISSHAQLPPPLSAAPLACHVYKKCVVNRKWHHGISSVKIVLLMLGSPTPGAISYHYCRSKLDRLRQKQRQGISLRNGPSILRPILKVPCRSKACRASWLEKHSFACRRHECRVPRHLILNQHAVSPKSSPILLTKCFPRRGDQLVHLFFRCSTLAYASRCAGPDSARQISVGLTSFSAPPGNLRAGALPPPSTHLDSSVPEELPSTITSIGVGFRSGLSNLHTLHSLKKYSKKSASPRLLSGDHLAEQ